MSRPNLSNHPAVSFTVKRPSPLSRDVSEPATASNSHTFKAPVKAQASTSSPLSFANANPNVKRSASHQPSRNHQGGDDSSDEDAGTEDEIITGFDSLGVQRCVPLSHLRKCERTPLKTHKKLYVNPSRH